MTLGRTLSHTEPGVESAGYEIMDSYLSSQECADFRRMIETYRKNHQLVEIHRPAKPRTLRYRVIEGREIREKLPAIWDLYTGPILHLMNELFAVPLAPLDNVRAGVNVNLMAPGRSSYRWHYDRNEATAILYLNAVEGGQIELYPNYRVLLTSRNSLKRQRILDKLIHFPPIRRALGNKVVVAPDVGRLLVMRANRCWHSVRTVEGSQERVNIVLAYDQLGAEHPMQASLDKDLYSRESHSFKDPNYGV